MAQGEDLRLGQHHMMILLVQRLLVRQFAIGGHANRAGMEDHGVLFIDGQPERNFGGKFAEQQPGIAHECLPGFAVQPAAFKLQRPRQVEVVQRDDGGDAMAGQGVDQAVIKRQPGRIHRAIAVRYHPRPGHRKTVGLQPHLRHQRDVLLHAMIVVAGDAEVRRSRRMAEHIDHRRAFTLFIPRALDLIGRGGRAPQKTVRELRFLLINHACASLADCTISCSP